MYHYDPATALEELADEAVLPNPVHMRDMILRAHVGADHSTEMNRKFIEYQRHFADAMRVGKGLLEQLAESQRRSA